MRVPVDAIVGLPFRLELAERADRTTAASWTDDTRLVPVGAPTATIHAGERAWFVPVEGVATGTVDVVLESDGLPPLHVPVEVVPRRIYLENGALVLHGIDGTRDGKIELSAPEGGVFVELTIPEPASDFLVAEGIGTANLILTFTASPDVPAMLALPVLLSNVEPGARVAVYDRLQESPLSRNGYLIPVR